MTLEHINQFRTLMKFPKTRDDYKFIEAVKPLIDNLEFYINKAQTLEKELLKEQKKTIVIEKWLVEFPDNECRIIETSDVEAVYVDLEMGNNGGFEF